MTVVTAKDKLRRLLGHGVGGTCVSVEADGVDVYSAALSEQTLARGAELLAASPPDLMYLSTSDYVQHTHAPGDPEANRFYAALDRSLAEIDRLGATLVVTADHGMRAKADTDGRVRAVYLQDVLDLWLGAGVARVVLPITDPYVRHHGALGSCAMVYLADPDAHAALRGRIEALPGVDVAADRDEACRCFDLPARSHRRHRRLQRRRPRDRHASGGSRSLRAARAAPIARRPGGAGGAVVREPAGRRPPAAAQLRCVRRRAERIGVTHA